MEREFYAKFWSLQNFLANPPLLFQGWTPSPAGAPSTPTLSRPSRTAPASPTKRTAAASSTAAPQAEPSTANLAKLNEGIARALEVFQQATEKEKQLNGSSAAASKGKDRTKVKEPDPSNIAEVTNHYFFPKFLTSRNLLDLEVC